MPTFTQRYVAPHKVALYRDMVSVLGSNLLDLLQTLLQTSSYFGLN